MRCWIAILLLACLCAPLASAQETPLARAQSIVEALSARTTQPPVYALAKLNTAPPDVCAELAKLMLKMPSANARRLIAQISQSTNANALAALLIPLGEEKNEIAADCLIELISQDLPKIIEICAATPDVDPEILGNLEKEGRWPEIVDAALRVICTPTDSEARKLAMAKRQLALALLVDTFAGERSFHYLMDGINKLIVGDKAAYELVEKANAENARILKEAEEQAKAEGRARDANDFFGVPEGNREAELALQEAKLINARKEEARTMFERILFVAAERVKLNLGTFDELKENADNFWENAADKLWHDDAPSIKRWTDHIVWASRGSDDQVKSLLALQLMDRICGGVTIPIPAQELEALKQDRLLVLKEAYPEGEIPEEVLHFDDLPKTVSIFQGDTIPERTQNFEKLHARNSQRPRKRALRAAFSSLLTRLRG